MPRKFLFVSLDGLIGDIAWQVAKEGHDVKYFIANEEEREIADGFVEKSDDWQRDADWADVDRFRRRARAGREGAGAAQAGQAGRRRHALHRSARGRPRVRPGRAQGGGRRDHPAGELHVVRRGDRLRAQRIRTAT